MMSSFTSGAQQGVCSTQGSVSQSRKVRDRRTRTQTSPESKAALCWPAGRPRSKGNQAGTGGQAAGRWPGRWPVGSQARVASRSGRSSRSGRAARLAGTPAVLALRETGGDRSGLGRVHRGLAPTSGWRQADSRARAPAIHSSIMFLSLSTSSVRIHAERMKPSRRLRTLRSEGDR